MGSGCYYSVAQELFLDGGRAQNSEIASTSLFSNVRFYEQDTPQTCLDKHQLHTPSSDRNFFRIIFYHGKQDCLLPLGFSNYARITTKDFVSACICKMQISQ